MENTILYLIGHYGVGKLTVAKAICAASGARLFDNHLANNIIFSLIRTDGKTPLPNSVWNYIWRIRIEAVNAIAELAPPEFSYVLTNALLDSDFDRTAYQQIVDLAAHRGSVFVPVILTCSEEENQRRVAEPDRELNMKHTDPVSALQQRRATNLLPIDHPNRLDLDNTNLSPEEAAAQIIAHAKGCAK